MTSVKPVEGVGVAVPPVLVPPPDTMPLGMVLKSGGATVMPVLPLMTPPLAQHIAGGQIGGQGIAGVQGVGGGASERERTQ